jgi:hypothetical protein
MFKNNFPIPIVKKSKKLISLQSNEINETKKVDTRIYELRKKLALFEIETILISDSKLDEYEKYFV